MNGQSTKLAPKAWVAMIVVLFLAAPLLVIGVQDAGAVTAKVVVMDKVIVHNRLGAMNQNGMMYALYRDVVNSESLIPLTLGGAPTPDFVTLRPDKRPRPLILRVAAGDTLTVELINLLTQVANPDPPAAPGENPNLQINDQVANRCVGFHVQGMQLVSINDDSSFVGKNASSLVCQGEGAKTYTFLAEREGSFLVTSYGQTFGGEASGGNVGVGLFGQVNVEPPGAVAFRSDVTEEELRLATIGTTAAGQPIINYDATYPDDCGIAADPNDDGVWCMEGKAGLPVLKMTNDLGEIVHSDINAIIAYQNGPGDYGRFPADTYPQYNATVPNRLEPFREFASIFHDENAVSQAFPGWFDDILTSHTLHGVRDTFMINYGSGGIGSEIIANRVGVGPMWDCLDCAYEEFFLTAFTVGDPAMIVDTPANIGLEEIGATTDLTTVAAFLGPKAERALYPDDVANVHHSYTGDFTKFRNVHAGPKEQHIFHLHNHQWLFNANDDNSNYLDAQSIGPGSSYTYEINFGGGGNRNKTAGDAIFHCHFYPHFAQGMWYLWRLHDVLETGTILEVTTNGGQFHNERWALQNGTPALVSAANTAGLTAIDETGLPGTARVRAHPDGEILVGIPIPAIVPLPGKPMALMPGDVVIVQKDSDGVPPADSSQAHVIDRNINPGFPFWIAGVDCGGDPVNCPSGIVGQRPATPPMDMLTTAEAQALKDAADPIAAHPGFVEGAGGWDGGLPRHALEGYAALGKPGLAGRTDPAIVVQTQTTLDFSKEVHKAKPVYFPETGTQLERLAMEFHATRCYDTFYPDGNAANCAADIDGNNLPDGITFNGAPPVPGAPFQEPCVDDQGDLLVGAGDFFSGAGSGAFFNATVTRDVKNPRIYAGANIQFDAVFNKLGYHYPQQRILALWGDVNPIIDKEKAPEPLVIRLNTFDCVKYLHANLVPREFELDDYQVRTPTDIIGQHIHLPKWDLTTADGAGNGWNYEDGTLSPGTVRERVVAINHYTDEFGAVTRDTEGNEVANSAGQEIEDLPNQHLVLLDHPYFGAGLGNEWKGARTTLQRWFADPVVNSEDIDRGLGIIFTHDHYGPSTHQQIGLYATVLTEPYGSKWSHNETGEALNTRVLATAVGPTPDGGPTSWQAIIEPTVAGGPGQVASAEPYREFYFEFSDFQHAYEPGVYVGAGPDGRPHAGDGEITHVPAGPGDLGAAANANFPAGPDTFRYAINPSAREEANPVFPDIVEFRPICPNGRDRPCSEAISADDIGMFVVNYRNEPIAARVYDNNKLGPDLKPGTQADGLAGDLAFALQSRTDRAFEANNASFGPLGPNGGRLVLNAQPGLGDWVEGPTGGKTFFPPSANVAGKFPGDPFTDMPRGMNGDLVRIKFQTGATEHEHSVTVHGVKWMQAGSGHGEAPNSGWRNAQGQGISEQMTFAMPVNADLSQRLFNADYAYQVSANHDGWWGGTWGVMRNYRIPTLTQGQLEPLPGSNPNLGRIVQILNFRRFKADAPVCPVTSIDRPYDITAVQANDVLPNNFGLDVQIIPDDPGAANLHEGAQPDAAGGTLVYNPRPTNIPEFLPPAEPGEPAPEPVPARDGPIHDPTGMMYVMTDDLEPVDGLCDVRDMTCDVKLKDDAPVEPIVLRAAAGECIRVTLRNRLPEVAYDLGGFMTMMQLIIRDRGAGAEAVKTFQNNLVRPSSYVGIHPQLVEYDVTQADGANVGTNGPNQLVPPGEVRTYAWYAGHTELNGFIMESTPVEFGGSNLNPADKIKQGQKGLLGALIIEPQGASWPAALEQIADRQQTTDPAVATRGTRAQTTVTAPGESFRDFAVVMQKGMNQRFAKSEPVPNIAGEGGLIPEDSHDSGQAAVNYGTEPMWFRFGLPAQIGFGDFGKAAIAEQVGDFAYSNFLDIGQGPAGEPATPVFFASAGEDVRLRVMMPHGAGRGTTFDLNGHVWQHDPYICPGSAHNGLAGQCEPDEVGSQAIGLNPVGMWFGGQDGVMPTQHYDIVPSNGAGGANAVPGDFLWRDHGSFGNTDGLWGIMRVESGVPQ